MYDYSDEMERHERLVDWERMGERRTRRRIHVRHSCELELEDYEVAGQEVRDIMQGQGSKRGLEGAAVGDGED